MAVAVKGTGKRSSIEIIIRIIRIGCDEGGGVRESGQIGITFEEGIIIPVTRISGELVEIGEVLD